MCWGYVGGSGFFRLLHSIIFCKMTCFGISLLIWVLAMDSDTIFQEGFEHLTAVGPTINGKEYHKVRRVTEFTYFGEFGSGNN
jgi:hypothetical protein